MNSYETSSTSIKKAGCVQNGPENVVDMVFDHPNEEADFCLNRCPHQNKVCKGSCPEFEKFYETIEEKTRNEVVDHRDYKNRRIN